MTVRGFLSHFKLMLNSNALLLSVRHYNCCLLFWKMVPPSLLFQYKSPAKLHRFLPIALFLPVSYRVQKNHKTLKLSSIVSFNKQATLKVKDHNENKFTKILSLPHRSNVFGCSPSSSLNASRGARRRLSFRKAVAAGGALRRSCGP